MIELYAITDVETPPLPGAAPLRAVVSGGLTAVCGEARDEAVTADALWRHERAVEALMCDRDLLPVRYGTRFEGEDAVARAVSHRRADLVAALDRVRGAVELSVRVHGLDEPKLEPVAASGAEYLRARIGRDARRESAAMIVDEPLRRLARASVRRAPGEATELLRVAYLVDRDEVEPFRSRVAELQASNSRLALLCTGPWPPYSFAES